MNEILDKAKDLESRLKNWANDICDPCVKARILEFAKLAKDIVLSIKAKSH